jgi:hypothetical protein
MTIDGVPLSVSLATIEIIPTDGGSRLRMTEHGAYFDAADSHGVPRGVDLEISESHLQRHVDRSACAGKELLHAEHEFARAERLGNVVVGTDLEADNAIGLCGFRSEHDDRNRCGRRIAAKQAADIEPIDLREHEVEHDERGPIGAGLCKGRLSIGSLHRIETCLTQFERQHLERVGLVVDDQYPRLHFFRFFSCRMSCPS